MLKPLRLSCGLLLVLLSVGSAGANPVLPSPALACPPIALNPLPNAIVGVSYTGAATASGGISPYSYALTGGLLPTGLTLNPSSGALTTTPSATGTFAFQITATDAGACTGASNYTVVVGSAIATNDLVIREFRSRGPAGALDEYIEIANRSAGPLTIASTEVGSTGFGIASESLGRLATIPDGTIIPAGGFYLAANSTPAIGYSLVNYGGASAASLDASWTADLPDNTGIGLFRSSTTFTANPGGTVLDAVGFVGSASPYLETTGIPVASATGTSDVVYLRQSPGGVIQDTGDNASDFYLGDTNAAAFGPVTARLAAPGPQNVASEKATGLTFTLADPTKAATTFPNRYRVTITPTTGIYYFRWKVQNDTGAAITKLRVRVSNVTTKNSPGYVLAGTQADFRLITTTDAAMTVPAAVTALATAVQVPGASLPLDGGYNTSASVILPGGTLANGSSVYINVGFKYEQAGSYAYFVSGEGAPPSVSNAAPVFATTGGVTAFTEDGGSVVVDSGLTVTDDSGTLASATVTITNLQDAGLEILSATASGGITAGNITYSAPTLTITAAASAADYQAVLRSVRYNNTSQNPTTTTRVLNFAANDGSLPSNTASKSVSVAATNDAPVLTAGAALSYTENDAATAIDNTVTVSDPDSANITQATVQLTTNYQNGQDVLSFATIGPISGTFVAGTGTLTLNGTDTLANYQAALRSVKYNNSSENPSTLARTVQWRATDSAALQSLAGVTSTINVTAVNDAPVVTAGATLGYTENQAAAVIDGTVTVTDVDSPNITGATVQITGNYANGNDVLSYVTALGISGSFGAGSGTLTLTGTTTLANYQTALRNVRYNNTSENPTTLARTISWQVNDGAGANNLSTVVTSTINVTAVNDPPTVLTKAASAQANMKIVGVAPGLLTGAVDPDNGINGCSTTLSIASINTGTNGTVSNVNPGAGTFDFEPNAGFVGNATATYTVSDNGCPGPGATSALATINITVNGPVIWFVNPAAVTNGDGRLSSPFNSLASANTAKGTSVNHRIFVYTGSTAGGVGVTLAGDVAQATAQWLVGQGATGASFDSLMGISPPSGTISRPTIGGTRPTIAGTLTLNGNNVKAQGFNVSTTTSTGVNDAAGAITGVNVSEVSVASTTGTAVLLSSLGGTVSFTSVSSNGATNGISLTSTTGSFTVTGSAGTCTLATPTCTGGSIQSSTGPGIFIGTSAQNVSLSFMKVQNSGTNSVTTTGVNGFTLDNSIVTDSAGVATDDGLSMANTSGSVSITNSAISNIPHNGMTFDNFNTNMASFTMTNSTIQCQAGQPCQPSGSLGNDGLLLEMRGTSVLPFGNIQSNTFSGVRAVAVQIQANDSGRIGVNNGAASTTTLTGANSFVVQSNTFTGNGQGVDIDSSQISNVTFQVLSNTIVGKVTVPNAIPNTASSNAITCFTAAGADTGPTTHSFVGKIDGNIIGTQGVKDSGSGFGSGVRAVVQGQGTQGVVTINNNTIREVPNATIINIFGQNGAAASGSNTARFKVTNNTMPAPSGSNLALCGPANTACADTGIFVLADEGTPVTAVITGNTIYDVSTMNGSFGIYLAERIGPPAGAQLRVEGTGSVSAFTLANNTLAGANKFVDEGANTSLVAPGSVGAYPLLLAPGGVVASESPASASRLGSVGEHGHSLDRHPSAISQPRLDTVVSSAMARWSATGLNEGQLATLRDLKFEVADLPGWYLGEVDDALIRVDNDAGGNGWFIGSPGEDDALFAQEISATRRYTNPASAPAGRIDLLTALMHEMGHALGLSDTYGESDRDDIMYGYLTKGERRLPAAGRLSTSH